MSLSRSVLAITALCFSAACATAPAPPPSPVLAFNGTAACSDAPDKNFAETITVKMRQNSGDVTKTIDAQAPCMMVDGKKRPYAIFRLPEGVAIESIQAGGVFQRDRVFAAEIVTLNSELATVRTFGPEAYRNRGGSWSAFFQTRPAEKYVLVRADPALIGNGYYFTQHQQAADAASEQESADVTPLDMRKDYSYEGLVFVRIFLSEPSNVAPKAQ